MQLGTLRGEETIAWVRIIQNILTIVDPKKMETTTNGEWRVVLSRCLQTILQHCVYICEFSILGLILILCEVSTQADLIIAFPVILRLSLLGLPAAQVSALLRPCINRLAEMEIAIPAPIFPPPLHSPLLCPQHAANPLALLHRSQQLFAIPSKLTLTLWGEYVEVLWRVSMISFEKGVEWDGLSSRLLVWLAIAGAERSQVGQWERREMVMNLMRQVE